jgi:hypothetical protein
VPVLRGVGREWQREQLVRGHAVLLHHRLQHPRQALRPLRLLPTHLRLRRRRRRRQRWQQLQRQPVTPILLVTGRSLVQLLIDREIVFMFVIAC